MYLSNQLKMTTFLITGASKGIGRQLARQLIYSGHEVWGFARDVALLKNLAEELHSPRFHFSVGNVGCLGDWHDLKMEMKSKHFMVEVLFLNAGVYSDDSEENFRTNFEGVKNGWKTFGEDLKQKKSSVIVIGSVFAFLNPSFNSSYSLSKHKAWQFIHDLSQIKSYHNIKFQYYTLGPINSGRNYNTQLGWRSLFIPSAEKAAAYIISRIENGEFLQFYPLSSKLLIIMSNFLPYIILDRLLILLKR